MHNGVLPPAVSKSYVSKQNYQHGEGEGEEVMLLLDS